MEFGPPPLRRLQARQQDARARPAPRCRRRPRRRPAARRPRHAGGRCRPARRRRTRRRCRSGRWPGPRAGRSRGARGRAGTSSSSAARRCRSARHLHAGDRGAVPVPLRTTASISLSTVRATFGAGGALGVAARPWAARSRAQVRRRPRRPIVAATVAICSAVAWTRPWPIAVEPTARSSPISPAAGIVLSAAPGDVGRLVEAEALGGGDEPLGAELDAERGEDRVARLREGVDQRASARLAVGVLEVDAFEHGLRSGREGVGGLVIPASSAPVGVIILNVEPGGWSPERRSRRRPGSRRCAAGAPRRRPGAPRARRPPPARRQRDRRAHGGGLARGARLSTRAPATSSPPGRAEQALVEDPLQARHADLRVGRYPERGELLAVLGRDRAELADDLGREQRRRRAVVALGQHGAVAGQQRGARGHPRHAAQPLAGREPGKTSARDQSMPSPVAGRTTSPATVPNARVGMRTGSDRRRRLARPGRVDLRCCRGPQGVLVSGGERARGSGRDRSAVIS